MKRVWNALLHKRLRHQIKECQRAVGISAIQLDYAGRGPALPSQGRLVSLQESLREDAGKWSVTLVQRQQLIKRAGGKIHRNSHRGAPGPAPCRGVAEEFAQRSQNRFRQLRDTCVHKNVDDAWRGRWEYVRHCPYHGQSVVTGTSSTQVGYGMVVVGAIRTPVQRRNRYAFLIEIVSVDQHL